jgi:hypothetical protein
VGILFNTKHWNPNGKNCDPFLVEIDFTKQFKDQKKAFNFTFRYADDVMFNHPIFSNKIPIIYPQRF